MPLRRLVDNGRRPGFDFTGQMRALCVDLSARLPELGYIDMERVAIRFCQTRKAVRHGMQASLTPLRFAGGRRTEVRRGRTWSIEPLYDDAGREMLYLLSFYLPRFFDQPFEEKLATVVHELWHMGPEFDGDLRRFEGRCYAHGASEASYHDAMHQLAAAWLALDPPQGLHQFLRLGFRELKRAHGTIWGRRIRTPRLVEQKGAADPSRG